MGVWLSMLELLWVFCMMKIHTSLRLTSESGGSHFHTQGSIDNLDVLHVLFIFCIAFFSNILYCVIFSYVTSLSCLSLLKAYSFAWNVNTNSGGVLKILIECWPKMHCLNRLVCCAQWCLNMYDLGSKMPENNFWMCEIRTMLQLFNFLPVYFEYSCRDFCPLWKLLF